MMFGPQRSRANKMYFFDPHFERWIRIDPWAVLCLCLACKRDSFMERLNSAGQSFPPTPSWLLKTMEKEWMASPVPVFPYQILSSRLWGSFFWLLFWKQLPRSWTFWSRTQKFGMFAFYVNKFAHNFSGGTTLLPLIWTPLYKEIGRRLQIFLGHFWNRSNFWREKIPPIRTSSLH